MTKEQADFLMQMANDVGIEAELREGYSGRGMYGKTTCGIVTPVDPLKWWAMTISYLKGLNQDGLDDVPDITNLHSDNMGRDIIIY